MNTETDLGGAKSPAPDPSGDSPTRDLGGKQGNPYGIPERIGKYRISRMIGRGGMGLVYEGRDETLDRSVAIKMITPELCSFEETFNRFRTEARAAARLSHPNIINVYEFGDDPAQPFLVMEFVEGKDLSALMKERGPLPPDEALRIIRQAGSALQKAAAANLIHRDIKPSNILLTKDGHVKVMDFGLSKLLDSSLHLTASGAMMGTPDYMSPEQARGEKLDYRTDVYSLGCTLFALLAGKKPFQSESLPGMIHKHVNESLPIPPDWKRHYGGRLVALLGKMTAKNRDDRPPTWDLILREIDGMLGSTQGTGAPLPSMTHASRRSQPVVLYAILAVALLSIGLGAGFYLNKQGRAKRPKANTTIALAQTTPPGTSTAVAAPAPTLIPTPLPTPEPNPPATQDQPPARAAGPGRGGPVRAGIRRGLEEMAQNVAARQNAMKAMQAGNFREARTILETQLNEDPPLPRPITFIYEAILEIMNGTDRIEEKVANELGKQNAPVNERIAAVKRWVSNPPPNETAEDLWFSLLYLHLLRDPGVEQAFNDVQARRPQFGRDQRQRDAVGAIDAFYNPLAGFPPASRQ